MDAVKSGVTFPSIVLSFGGVLGIMVATILTIDGLVLILKRINEEFNNGKMLKPSIKTAFKRSVKPILNSTIFAVILSGVLFILANGAVKGFAITLAIGSVLSAISTLVLARMVVSLLLPIVANSPKAFNLKREEITTEAE